MAWRIGVDVGGTLTDPAAVADTGDAIHPEKIPTTPADQSIGVMTGLQALLEQHGVPPAAVTYLGHGTTVCINAEGRAHGACHHAGDAGSGRAAAANPRRPLLSSGRQA